MKTIAADISKPLFTAESAKNDVIPELKSRIQAPYFSASVSTLGGQSRPTIMMTISLDPKDQWKNGILENSRYGKFSLDYDGTFEYFSGSLPKFRKRKFASVDKLRGALNTYLNLVPPKS